MKKVISLILALGICLSLCSCDIDTADTSITNLNSIACSPEDVEQFLNKVCNKIDGEYAKVIDPDYAAPAAGCCYSALLEVKLNREDADKVQVIVYFTCSSHFRGPDVQVVINASESEYEFNCKKELIMALERTLGGETTAAQYITTINDMYNRALSYTWGKVAEYDIKDNHYAVITGAPVGSDCNWVFYYSVYLKKYQ